MNIDWKKSITASELKEVDGMKVDKVNFELLSEFSDCLQNKDNILDSINKIKFILDQQSEISLSLLFLNFCYVINRNLLDMVEDCTPEDIYELCSVVNNTFDYFNDLEKGKIK